MTIIAIIGDYIDDITNNFTKIAGAVSFTIMCFNRLAKLTPTNFSNKYVQKVARFFYGVFSVLGVNVPDIESIAGGKIITTQEAVVNKAMEAK